MRTILLFFCLLLPSLAVVAKDDPKPIASVEEGVRLVQSFEGKPEDFVLAIPDSLLDSQGINIAIITNEILKRRWMPDDVIQRSGYRVFTYKQFEWNGKPR